MDAISRRAVAAVAGATIALTVGGIGTASAHDKGGNGNGGSNCSLVGIEYKVDGGRWTTAGRIGGDTAPGKISVRLTSSPGKNCSYTVSLASYSAEGPAWENSGHQDFLGWDTVTLGKGKTKATLDVSGHVPDCFGQVDLYGNGTQYDGGTGEGHGALPHFPDSATPTDLITAWNGGHKCETSPSPSPTETTDSPSPSPTETTDSPSPSPTETTDSPSPSPSVSDTSSPSPTATGPTSTTAPTGTPSVPPATGSSNGTGNLAETGSNSSQNTALIGGAAALLVAGGAAVYFTRRRRTGNHS
ncbi:LAETG motif-containing sortase-dependent surface protein [Streptomyces sp. NPDC004031]